MEEELASWYQKGTKGKDIRLTIDTEIQKLCNELLKIKQDQSVLWIFLVKSLLCHLLLLIPIYFYLELIMMAINK